MASSQAVDIRKKSEGRVHIVRMVEKDLQLVQLDRMKRKKKTDSWSQGCFPLGYSDCVFTKSVETY